MLAVHAVVALVGLGVGSHIVAVNRTFGGTQGYAAYLGSKLDLHLVALDLTWAFCGAAILATAVGLWRARRDPAARIVLFALLVIGVRAVHGWTWARAAGACALALVAPVVLALALSSL